MKSITALSKFYKSQEGGIMLMWAVTLPVIIGTVGLGVETGSWYLDKRNMQTAADAAALAGARETTSAKRTLVAQYAVVQNGFSNGSGVNVTVNNPPTSGSYTTSENAVEVILSKQQSLTFSSLIFNTSPVVTVRAVAVRQSASTASGCVVALANNGTGIDITGSSTMNMPTCTLISNSNINASVDITGNSTTNVYSLYTQGNYQVGGSASFNTVVTPTIHGNDTPDPYSNMTVPSFSGCDNNNFSTSSTTTLSPGVYCNGFRLTSHANVTLNPGVYIIDRGSFDIGSQATLSGTGVTFIFTSSTSSGYPTITVNGGATVSLTSPSTGEYSGIAFYQDRRASTGNVNRFNGGSTMQINGAIYMPSAHLNFNGGSAVNAACTQIVSNTVDFSGNNNIKSDCSGAGMTQITPGGYGSVKLQE
jgi:Flp pilus assembly protein TadG